MTSFFVKQAGEDIPDCDVCLERNVNLLTGESDFISMLGEPTSLESDLLLIGASVFAADRASERGEREDIGRKIELDIPIINVARLVPLSRRIEMILRTLSNDAWRINLRQANGASEKPLAPEKVNSGKGATLLFSGGLDSLAAAIEFSGAGYPLQLVSHVTKNVRVDKAQKNLVAMLADAGTIVPHYQFFVSSKTTEDGKFRHDVEETQRTRSFLFLVLAGIAARRARHHEILYLAGNGQMAVHLPLTSARIGAFSTHTAHPDFLAQVEEFLSLALGTSFVVRNPYVHFTKAEITKKVVDAFPGAIVLSNSCWRNTHVASGETHCGECIPCYVRRIAIEFWTKDLTLYARDTWLENISGLGPQDTGKRNIADLAEFVLKVHRLSEDDIMAEWPELYSPNINSTEVIKMYKRFADEALHVLGRYPSLCNLLS